MFGEKKHKETESRAELQNLNEREDANLNLQHSMGPKNALN